MNWRRESPVKNHWEEKGRGSKHSDNKWKRGNEDLQSEGRKGKQRERDWKLKGRWI